MGAAQVFDACVIGAGPAGSACAIRLAQLGHLVCLVERSAFPRAHVGESLTGGVWPLFDALGLRDRVRSGEFLGAGDTLVKWETPQAIRIAPSQRDGSILVRRADFDAMLLAAAVEAGVHVLQPFAVRSADPCDEGWRLHIEGCGGFAPACAGILIDASGRRGFLRGEKRRLSAPTVALCGYVPDCGVRGRTCVEALPNGWCWGASVPGGSRSVMAFVGAPELCACGNLERRWRAMLADTELFREDSEAELTEPVVARNATSMCASEVAGDGYLKIGEAALALDPLSSTGVEKAMQSGVVGAVVAHTVLLQHGRVALAQQFHRDRHAETVASHVRWAAGFYSEVKRFGEHAFWRERSPAPHDNVQVARAALPDQLSLDTNVRLSGDARIVDEACIVEDLVQSRRAVRHPGLERPVAFVDGLEAGCFLDMAGESLPLHALLGRWADHTSPERVRRFATWCFQNRLLEAS